MSLKVLVVGAGGFIGDGIAKAMRRAGYIVYGVARREEVKAHLTRHEIIPIIGGLEKPEAYKDIIEQCSVIIDAAGVRDTSPIFFEYIKKIKAHTVPNYKTLYIFTSGIMNYYQGYFDESLLPKPDVHEPTPTDPDEMIPRKKLEDEILKTTSIRTVVIRPGFVYGGHGGVILPLFFDVNPNEKKLELIGSPHKRWSWVHVDDLGEAYVRVVKAGSIVDSQLFNISAQDCPTYQELKVACAQAAGWKGTLNDLEFISVDDACKRSEKEFNNPEHATRFKKWETNVIINPQKAFDLLGWRPNHVGVLNEAQLYYDSWKAAKIYK